MFCQLDGLLGIFSAFTGAAYNFSLAHLILTVSMVFNPGGMKSTQYHLLSISFGIVSSLIALLLDDIGITVCTI